ncbi:outer dense fiber protein 4 [Bos javanicus]|uniref:outer dense fiber protein 4 n=1 Tax=Bos javanicus TaxID=9906 RepID=UPI000572D737|nr:PREDICTED: outer dense fiber protein 4 [Bos mutus]XP_061246997.1 outer dense fiber protein 4 [Bos javanicus]
MNSLGQEEKGMNIRSLERAGRAGKQDGVAVSPGQEEEVQNCVSTRDSNWPVIKDHSVKLHRVSPLLLQCRITHSSRWIAQVLASELSLLAFILLVVMVFSKKWLCFERIRFYQHWPMNVTTKIYTSVHIMSLGLLHIYKSKSYSNSEWESFKLWTNHPAFGVAKITFCLALGLGIILTIWLHLPYIPGLQKLPFFGWIGTVMSFCEAFFVFFTLILFPVNIWLFELRKNLSIPLCWSYFIGWLVFILYVICAVLCYFNHGKFWCLILSHPTSSSSSSSSEHESVSELATSNTTVSQEEVLDPEKKKASLAPSPVYSSKSASSSFPSPNTEVGWPSSLQGIKEGGL